MRKLFLLFPLVLAGCNTVMPVEVQQNTLVMPSEMMYHCPTVKQYPNPDTLTDAQVAKLLVELNANNKLCKASINSIRKFLNDSQGVLNQPK